MQNLIKKWYEDEAQNAALSVARANSKFASLLSEQIALTGRLLSLPSDARAWTRPENQFAIALNREAMSLAKTDPTAIAKLASATVDPVERSRLFAVAASSETDASKKAAWLVENAISTYAAAAAPESALNWASYSDAIATVKTAKKLGVGMSDNPYVAGGDLNAAASGIENWSQFNLWKLDKSGDGKAPTGNFHEPQIILANPSTLPSSYKNWIEERRNYMTTFDANARAYERAYNVPNANSSFLNGG